MHRVASHVIALALAGLSAVSLRADPIDIVSQAAAQYVPSGSAGELTIASNAVHVTVNTPPSFSLTGTSQQNAANGAVVTFVHQLVNSGSAPLNFWVQAQVQAGGTFAPTGVRVYSDINGNGQLESNDPEIKTTDLTTVPAGHTLSLIVSATVPANARPDQTATVAIMARETTTAMQSMRTNTIDIVAPATVMGFFVEKTVSRNEAEIGETVVYTVRVKNISVSTIDLTALSDSLALGFTYVPRSARLTGQTLAEPTISSSGLAFDLGRLAAGDTATITYSARINASALSGSGISWAQANATGLTSNQASARVTVTPGVFDSKATIIGRVFLDADRDGRFDAGDLGVPGIRIYLEDGTSALTDVDGKYSFYGLDARSHVVKLDRTTLPAGAAVSLTTNDQAGDAGSQFANLKYYELHKSNFALVATSDEARTTIEERRAAIQHPAAEISRGLADRLTTDGAPVPIADPKALPSSGVVGAGAAENADGYFPAVTRKALKPAPLAGKPAAKPEAEALSPLAGVKDAAFGFVLLRDHAVLPTAQTDVWVKGPVGARFELAVNGAIIGDKQVGTRAIMPDRGIEAWNFVGVDLNPGENRLRVTMLDPFGNRRGSVTIKLLAPGALAFIKVIPPEHAVADGSTVSFVTVELIDARGTPVTARTPLTLETDKGAWKVDDLDPTTPGTQVFIEGGRRRFPIAPPLMPGDATLHLTSGAVKAESTLAFEPNLRPMIATGVIEGSLQFGSRSGTIFPVGTRDAFEQELRSLSANSADGRLAAGSRAAFFLKGKIKGDYLLTAACDTDKASQERLFRDIQPGEFYPVYGDASERGYDAQSTGKLYVRIDHARSYLLVGDFTTASSAPTDASGQSLGNYQRSLNGAKEHYEAGRVVANVWGSQDSSNQVVLEVPANGTSGPFVFPVGTILENSEQIEILTRDRNQSSRIIASRTLVRFDDYEFDPLVGNLLMKAPVPSVDADLNPISIRLTAEVDEGGKKFWAYGGDAHVKVTSKLTVGGGYANAENTTERTQLASADATYQFGEHTKLLAEAARSDSSLNGDGWAERADFTHQDAKFQAHAFLAKTDANFENTSAIMLPGRVEGGFDLKYKLGSATTLHTQGILSEVASTGEKRKGVLVEAERSFGNWKLDLGVRHSDDTGGVVAGTTTTIAKDEVDSLRTRLTVPLPFARASAYGEYEHDVRSDRQLAAAGFDYTFKSGGRAYARHEFITSIDGPYDLQAGQAQHTTVFGLERDYMKDGQVFNEYRADNELTGREAEDSVGLRNLWKIADGVRASTSFERITPVLNAQSDESTAVTGAIDYAVDPRWRANARVEFRTGSSTDSLLNTLGYARLLNPDWTFLGKSIVLVTDIKGATAGETIQARQQAGLAWRPSKSDRWNGLGKLEFKEETDNRTTAAFLSRYTRMAELDVNFQPNNRWIASAHYAGKWVTETDSTARSQVFGHLISERIGYTINSKWDVACNANTLFDGGFRQTRVAFGPEVGYLVAKNLTLGVGFNFAGFQDRDFTSDRSTAKGAFLRMRLKLDENMLPGHI